MNNYKKNSTLFFGGLACCVLGVVLGIFVYKSFYPPQPVAVENTSVTPTPIAREELVTSTGIDESKHSAASRTLTYKNQHLGFQFDYPETFYVEIKDGVDVGSTVLTLVELSKRAPDGYTMSGGFISFNIIAKEKADDMLQKLRRDYDRAQTQRKKECGNESSEGAFTMCAYYGGGVTYNTSTLQGVEVVERHFVGEGSSEVTIFVPSKGFSVSYDPVFVSSDITAILQSIHFFDNDRIITDQSTGIAFVCPAFWLCEGGDASYFNTISDRTRKYSLLGPGGQYLEMHVAEMSAEKIKEVVKSNEGYFAVQIKTNGLQVHTYSFLNKEHHVADVYEYGYKDQSSKTVLLFILDKGVAIGFSSYNTIVDQKYIETLFDVSRIK